MPLDSEVDKLVTNGGVENPETPEGSMKGTETGMEKVDSGWMVLVTVEVTFNA
jgi:hypothetical protein